MSRAAWLDLSSGASGDMLLGAFVGAGVPLAVLQDALAPLGLPVGFTVEPARRAGLAATRVHVEAPVDDVRRTWTDVRALLERLPDEGLRELAGAVFARLAEAEGRVHGIPADEVHFHEVGALDALADVVGVCAAYRSLGDIRLVASPVALGSGSVVAAHGRLPVPGPAVLELLRAAAMPSAAAGGAEDAASAGAGAGVELCTPTGAALVTTLADAFGTMPAMTVASTGTGAGARNLPGRPNVVRLVLGAEETTAGADVPVEPAVLIETNVDDLDPRLWPDVLARLLDAGAADAWLTPMLMKKGRPAHTLAVLCAPEEVARLREVVYRHTSTLGVRESPTTKRPLARDVRPVEVAGYPVAVKRGLLPDGTVVTVQPEWSDVAAAASASGLPAREVLARAQAAARQQR